MMIIEIKAPGPGESITQVLLASWLADEGVFVEKDAEVAEIESDKATLVVYATASGVLHHIVKEGETVDTDSVIATIDASKIPAEATPKIAGPSGKKEELPLKVEEQQKDIHITPLAKSIIEKSGIPAEKLEALHKNKITSKDLSQLTFDKTSNFASGQRTIRRVKMSPLRQKLAERLVSVKNETAMLTTFNEVNMSAIMDIRKKYGEKFKQQYGSGPGFLTFFLKAVTIAMETFPVINASFDGDEILYPDYTDICIAVSTPKGLLAPAIRDAQKRSLPEIEQKIRDFAVRAQENKITLDELSDGTFTISNGGVFGSLMSTPIINPPQSAILGLHKIEDRPVAVNGKVVILPMMYIALSYDHRLIDGKESVGFVVKVKELVENPLLMLKNDAGKPEQLLKL